MLTGRSLVLAVALRELVTFGCVDGLAPAWILVHDTVTQRQLFRVSAGRDAGAGERLFAVMTAEATRLSTPDFVEKWRE